MPPPHILACGLWYQSLNLQDKFSSITEVPRPPHFGGFRLRPDRIEFWKGRQTRIHDRIVYVVMDDKWIMQRLQP